MSRNNLVKSCALLIAVAALSVVAGVVQAESITIVSDTFTGAVNAAALVGRAPETTLSNGNWINPSTRAVSGQYWYATTSYGDPTPGVQGYTCASAAVSLAGSGTYAKPTEITISADVRVGSTGTTDTTANPGRGFGLGYWLNTSASTPIAGFVGLTLKNNGGLQLVYNPQTAAYKDGTSVFSSTVAWSSATGATFSTSAFYNLSYTVDTTTGKISNIVLEGSNADYSSLVAACGNYFTDTQTQYAGILVNSSANNTYGYVDNFLVTGVVPEPSTLALLACGLVGLLAYAWRKRK